MKRAVDVACAIAGLILLSPLLALVAVAVFVSSGWPVLFRQERVGEGGRRFRVLKFRTMRSDADSQGPGVTRAEDPRVTKVGVVLRGAKLDELPQLWNVLRGEMSLVGPRPEIPKYVALYEARFAGVLSVRPGLTDPASIVFRDEQRFLRGADHEEDYIRRILPRKLGLYERYVRRASLAYDLKLIAETLRRLIVPRCRGRIR